MEFQTFFTKFPPKFGEMTAIKMIHKKIESAQHKLKKDKANDEYLEDLAESYKMMKAFFAEKGIDPNSVV